MEDIGTILAESKTIRELDISWNVLKPESYNTLFAALGENKTLLTLNLSWNRIVESNETIIEEPIDPSMPASMINSKMNSPKQSKNIENYDFADGQVDETAFEVPWYEK